MIEIKKSLSGNYVINRGPYTFGLVNFISTLMERDEIEKALELINIYFGQLSTIEKMIFTENIFQATKQYDIPNQLLPEEYYDFVVSEDSDPIFNYP